MPGQICAGQNTDDIKNAKLRNSKSFCEGFLARAVAVPPAVPPHEEGSAAYNAYVAGVAAKAAETTPDENKGCCAPAGAKAT